MRKRYTDPAALKWDADKAIRTMRRVMSELSLDDEYNDKLMHTSLSMMEKVIGELYDQISACKGLKEQAEKADFLQGCANALRTEKLLLKAERDRLKKRIEELERGTSNRSSYKMEDGERIIAMLRQGMTKKAIAKELGISRTTLYERIRQYEEGRSLENDEHRKEIV